MWVRSFSATHIGGGKLFTYLDFLLGTSSLGAGIKGVVSVGATAFLTQDDRTNKAVVDTTSNWTNFIFIDIGLFFCFLFLEVCTSKIFYVLLRMVLLLNGLLPLSVPIAMD
jgi:hypothetical protein